MQVNRILIKRLFRFSVVGVVGMVVDASVLTICLSADIFGPYLSRVMSFAVAVFVTWLLNRRYTFASKQAPAKEFVRFLAANSLGAILNFCIYSTVIARYGTAGIVPVAGVAAGSLGGLISNFFLSSKIVFKVSQTKIISSTRNQVL